MQQTRFAPMQCTALRTLLIKLCSGISNVPAPSQLSECHNYKQTFSLHGYSHCYSVYISHDATTRDNNDNNDPTNVQHYSCQLQQLSKQLSSKLFLNKQFRKLLEKI